MNSNLTDEFFDVWCDSEWHIILILLEQWIILHLLFLCFSTLLRQLRHSEDVSLDFLERMLAILNILLSVRAWIRKCMLQIGLGEIDSSC